MRRAFPAVSVAWLFAAYACTTFGTAVNESPDASPIPVPVPVPSDALAPLDGSRIDAGSPGEADASADAGAQCALVVADDFSSGTLGPWKHTKSADVGGVDFSNGGVTLTTSGAGFSVLASPPIAPANAPALPAFVEVRFDVSLAENKASYTLAQLIGYFPQNVQLVTRSSEDGVARTLSLVYASPLSTESQRLPVKVGAPTEVLLRIASDPTRGTLVQLTAGTSTVTLIDPAFLNPRTTPPADVYFQMGPFLNLVGDVVGVTVAYDNVSVRRCR
ncbi:MAG: hypothetical protein IPF92_11705 [Myxococcales bacterium]|nr:hypothetical protein [Myxococcales bacterium]MBL0198257.1 hypothetical protein [Myxococcales bacterium]HQY62169.1 hypothetical protein [Polyangiaceae bacterium]